MAQKTYNYQPLAGFPGKLVDITPYVIDTRANEEEDGKMLYGVAVAVGSKPGDTMKQFTSEADVLEGITINGGTNEMNYLGKTEIVRTQPVGVLRWGRVWVRVTSASWDIAYGDQAYVAINAGEEGYLTKSSDGTAFIPARFISSAVVTGEASEKEAHIAQIELFQPALVPPPVEP